MSVCTCGCVSVRWCFSWDQRTTWRSQRSNHVGTEAQHGASGMAETPFSHGAISAAQDYCCSRSSSKTETLHPFIHMWLITQPLPATTTRTGLPFCMNSSGLSSRMSEVPWDLCWPPSLSLMSSRFMHWVAAFRIPFLSLADQSLQYACIAFCFPCIYWWAFGPSPPYGSLYDASVHTAMVVWMRMAPIGSSVCLPVGGVFRNN